MMRDMGGLYKFPRKKNVEIFVEKTVSLKVRQCGNGEEKCEGGKNVKLQER